MSKNRDIANSSSDSNGNDGISRRDFLNGMLMAAGGLAVGGFFPMRAFAHSPVGRNACDGSIGSDPRALRGGNSPQAFNIAHWLRDGRLTFSANSVQVLPAVNGCDPYNGSFPIQTDNGNYDLIIVGSGMSGLSAAFHTLSQKPNAKILLLDANSYFGGNASRDDATPIPAISATGGAYAVDPFAPFLEGFYGTIGVDWQANYIQAPFYNYFFDSHTPYVLPGTNSWTHDVYGANTENMPYNNDILKDFKKAKHDFTQWYNRPGSPTDPADNSDPRFDYLAHQTLHHYLTVEQGYHPAVSDFYTRYAVDALGGPSEHVNAYSAISFIASEYFPIFSYPGGTSGIARHALKWLIPASISGTTSAQIISNPINSAALDSPTSNVRIRQGSIVLRADNGSNNANVVYFKDGQFYRATAKAVIMASQFHSAHRIIEHLLTPTTLNAWLEFKLVPVVTANVTLRTASALTSLGLGYNNYWWGSDYWADFAIADWVTPNRNNPNRSTVLTFYGGNSFPPDEMPEERLKLLTTPFSVYEQSLKADLNRVLAGGGFDYDRDVSAVYIYRWGHGVIYPKLGFPFGVPIGHDGNAVRTPAPRHIARQQIGRISFAGQDVESTPSLESAIGSGVRTAQEIIPFL